MTAVQGVENVTRSCVTPDLSTRLGPGMFRRWGSLRVAVCFPPGDRGLGGDSERAVVTLDVSLLCLSSQHLRGCFILLDLGFLVPKMPIGGDADKRLGRGWRLRSHQNVLGISSLLIA